MKKIITTEKIPIKLWLADVEDGAMRQIKNIANFPFAFHHIAIMPDAHEGYGMPIGGVMATEKVIVPNAVGVDIGCGVCAQKTTLTNIEINQIKNIMADIRSKIPMGFNKHKAKQDENLMPEFGDWKNSRIGKEWNNACRSLGTLGGGNHFIEIQKGSDGHIWIMLHSGSRNLGKKVADYYNRSAINSSRRQGYEELIKQELAFLEADSEEGKRYINEMRFCVDYALANRKLMMARIKTAFANNIKDINWRDFINIAHNYASLEIHFGKEVIVHRKGATQAKTGQAGIIPGSQGTKSYIIKGQGNSESFCSCSHGAGRKMGRNQAIRELDLEEEIEKLDKKGIIHAIRSRKDLDEASGAYKNIAEIIKNQDDLVEVMVKLSPLAVIKG
ncbi:RtcB family protein [Candidatus Falkowbacteria bacterium CG_4_9_14_3_um_filter_36_9]|uniref:3'-phosphate/5'-hydroxy nucleic acid ligase n=2 Tax=Candidatus Falkowiibacteriota TaxID=1752728 RepID=A0A1J4T9M1_9BACT|nr:MAG: RNA-splicing ligase RtcB [Candidatus Falkowbacteria bacterium CG1_02_37_44]PIV51595.1 MAG: RtcB family protein [Candidatus Falkowbacteria bacterium CG02_land_8_20_14_3_00_36_14]PIX12213.1 MAG: RtcB family protein [Candidatus Falkowbacteria bacterium CG_4_8_14_3_um_filter_36_11]PJB17863.1 MAG: RtcB family protein [Candidatus Falkowbacteria bacterium CG_4_9_14_3_um_filter_36_9]